MRKGNRAMSKNKNNSNSIASLVDVFVFVSLVPKLLNAHRVIGNDPVNLLLFKRKSRNDFKLPIPVPIVPSNVL
jgi:hypothetical protein